MSAGQHRVAIIAVSLASGHHQAKTICIISIVKRKNHGFRDASLSKTFTIVPVFAIGFLMYYHPATACIIAENKFRGEN
jgi:hypothetical protein